MTNFVFANNVSTTLAAAVTSTATTLTLASSVGLPTLATGQVMPLTLKDAATGAIYETVYVTAITGVTLTATRAQEGTSAYAWNIGDYAFCAPTAGSVAPLNGSAGQQFQAAAATSSGQVVNLGQAQADFAALAGSATQVFSVAKGTGTNNAVTYTQLMTALGSYAGMLYGSTTAIPVTVAGYVLDLAPAVATTYTLPARSGFTTGQSFVIRNGSSSVVTIAVDSGSTFQPGGYTSIALQPGDDCEFVASASATTHWLLSRGSALRQYYPLVVASGATLTEAVNVSQLQADALTYAAASGTSSAIVVTRAIPAAAYTTGMRVKFLGSSAWTANSGAVTIAVDGLGTVNLYGKNATAMQGGEIVANGYYEAVFIGANFYLTSQVLGGIQIPAGTQSNHAVSLGQFTLSDAATGYEKLPDGTIRCWGQTASLAPGATATITLPITYPTAVRRVLATAIVSSGTAAAQSAGVTITSTSVITVTNTGTSTGTCAFFWETSGK